MNCNARLAAMALMLFTGCKKEAPSAPVFVQKNIPLKESLDWKLVGEWSFPGRVTKHARGTEVVGGSYLILRGDGTATMFGNDTSWAAEWGTAVEGTVHFSYRDYKNERIVTTHRYKVTGDKLTIIYEDSPIEYARQKPRDASVQ